MQKKRKELFWLYGEKEEEEEEEKEEEEEDNDPHPSFCLKADFFFGGGGEGWKKYGHETSFFSPKH